MATSNAAGPVAAGTVKAVSRSPEYTFAKPNRDRIRLLAGLGVEGDVHAGVTVRHRSRVARDPSLPNLRQVHLMHDELHEELRAEGYAVDGGRLGENITTSGIDLLALPTGTLLRIGAEAVVEVTGLRNPCGQLNGVGDGLMKRLTPRGADGEVVRLGGIMGVVRSGGDVLPGDAVVVELPDGPHLPLQPV